MEEVYNPHSKDFAWGFADNGALSFVLTFVYLLFTPWISGHELPFALHWILSASIPIGIEVMAFLYFWKTKRKYAIGMIAGLTIPFLTLGWCFTMLI